MPVKQDSMVVLLEAEGLWVRFLERLESEDPMEMCVYGKLRVSESDPEIRILRSGHCWSKGLKGKRRDVSCLQDLGKRKESRSCVQLLCSEVLSLQPPFM